MLGLQSNKRQSTGKKEEDQRDRLSNLPSTSLYHILSFLPTLQVVQTCLLSKIWKNIWCTVPSLNIGSELTKRRSMHDNFSETFLDCLLHQRDSSKELQSFKLSPYKILPFFSGENYNGGRESNRVNAWITYALRLNLQVLDIYFHERISLTPKVFGCRSLREITLRSVKICIPVSISLPSLRKLQLDNVSVVGNGRLEDLVCSVVPILEILILRFCSLENLSTVSSLSLKVLRLKGSFPRMLTISAPYLASLQLIPDDQDDVHVPEVLFNGSFVYLVDAKIHLPVPSFKLFEIFENIRSLSLSSNFLSSLPDVELHKEEDCMETHPLNNLRRLQFKTTFKEKEILTISNVLNDSPNVESIEFENMNKTDYAGKIIPTETVERMETGENVRLKHKLCHLKSIEIKGFAGSENEVALMKFLLENASVLETVNFTSKDRRAQIEICKRLITHPRSSANVEMTLTYQADRPPFYL